MDRESYCVAYLIFWRLYITLQSLTVNDLDLGRSLYKFTRCNRSVTESVTIKFDTFCVQLTRCRNVARLVASTMNHIRVLKGRDTYRASTCRGVTADRR